MTEPEPSPTASVAPATGSAPETAASRAEGPPGVPEASAAPQGRWGGRRDPVRILRYLGGKLLTAAVSLVAVMVTSFFLFRILPGDPVRTMTKGRDVTDAQMAELRHQFGLDKPLPLQFVDYCTGLLRFDFGTSYQFREPVTTLIAERIGPTLLLFGTGTLLAALLGLVLGTRAGWRRGSATDRVNTGVALTLWSVPSFWLGLMLIVVLASGAGGMTGLFPTGGMRTPGVTGALATTLDVAHHMVLPVITVVAVAYAQYLMIMRSSLLDEMGSDYLTTARAKGLRDSLVLRRHAAPNALLPTVTLIFMRLGQVVSGLILVETVFAWPGLGHLFYSALEVPDLPLVQALFVLFASAVILMNLLADLVYPFLDPRVRV